MHRTLRNFCVGKIRCRTTRDLTMSASINRQFLLAQRPVGLPSRETFEFVETPLGEPADGQILVKNAYLSLDPAMRGWMTAAKSYIPAVELGVHLCVLILTEI